MKISNKVAPYYFNILIENLNLESIAYNLKGLYDMQKIYINLNFFISYNYFLGYFKQCIEDNKIKNLDDFFEFSDLKLDEIQSIIINTDLSSDINMDLIFQYYEDIKKYIKNKNSVDLEVTILDFIYTCTDIMSKTFRQIKYLRYFITETFQDFLDIINKDIDFKNYKPYKFKQIKKYYNFINIDNFGKELEQ